MTNKITFRQVVESLEQNNQPYDILTLQNDVRCIITQRGARILGPYLSPESEGIFWINKAFADPGALAQFIQSGDWNLGGERNWIAPEVQYGVTDRTDFWGTVRIPPQMDPGHYSLEKLAPDQFRLSQSVTLDAFNLAAGQKALRLETLIHPIDDPLRNLSSYTTLIEGVIYAGYQQIVSLSEIKRDAIVSEVWNLVQLNPGGLLLIASTPNAEYSDHYEPIDENYQTIHPNHIRLKITGDRRYKVSYKAAHVFGRLAYYNHLDDGRAYLIVRNFFNNPSALYAEEPAESPGRRGHSIHVYNDGGMFGRFGELECTGQTIGGAANRTSSQDQLVLWLYVGAANQIEQIARHLIGVEL